MSRANMRTCVAMIALAAVLVMTSAAHAQQQVQAAIATAQQTGRPILFVVKQKCPLCESLVDEFEAAPELHAVLSEYVCLAIHPLNDANELAAWQELFPQEITLYMGHAFIVSPHGELLYDEETRGITPQLTRALYEGVGITVDEPVQDITATEVARRRRAALRADEEAEERAARQQAYAAGTFAPAQGDEPQPFGGVGQAASSEPQPFGGAGATEEASAENEAEAEDRLSRLLDGRLRMAQAFVERQPEKSRNYAQLIIDEAPESPQAEEARALLESLGEVESSE